VEQRGLCTIVIVIMDLTSITYVGGTQYSLKLANGGVLLFTFHKDIAQQAMHLFNQAHEEAKIAQGHQVIQERLAECAKVVARDARRCKVALAKSSSIHSLSCISPQPMFDDGKGSTGSCATDAAVAFTCAPVPFPPEVVDNALSGIEITLSREEQKAQRLKEAEEAQYQSKLAEQQRTTGSPIWIKTHDPKVVRTLLSIGRQHGFELCGTEQQYARGTVHFVDVSHLLNAGILTLRVSARGNEIVVGELTDDDTLRWGTCANVWNDSYDALVSMFPAMSVTVQQVVKTRAVLKIQKQHQHLQQGLLPVFDTWGNVVAYQQAPPFAHQHLQQGLLPNPGLVCVMPVCDAWGRFVGFQQAPPFA
jgi:hypothetical protein